MEKIVPKIMRGPLTPGGSRWSPILPPDNATVAPVAANDGIVVAPVASLPDVVTAISGPRAKLKLFRDL